MRRNKDIRITENPQVTVNQIIEMYENFSIVPFLKSMQINPNGA